MWTATVALSPIASMPQTRSYNVSLLNTMSTAVFPGAGLHIDGDLCDGVQRLRVAGSPQPAPPGSPASGYLK